MLSIINLFSCAYSEIYTALAPHIITHPIDTSAATPFGAEFTCSAKGCGHLNIMWHRHGNSLPMKAYSTLVTSGNEITSTLSIPIVTIEDAGKYYCMVWANMTATQSKTATLFLSGTQLLTFFIKAYHFIFRSTLTSISRCCFSSKSYPEQL